ncbi:MAG: hypothetical protein HUJ96_01605 [Marinilabiliaceae bacterium]|nr:hypothetical protein [Marinilabiliaceae bacterium]
MKSSPVFTYNLPEPGVATASLVVGDMFADFHLTNVCNPLNDLLSGFAQMILQPRHLWNETNNVRVVWYGDSEQYYWDMELKLDNQFQLKISEVCDFFGDDAIELLSTECSLFEILLPVIKNLDVFIKQVGLLNYYQKWQKDEFPLTLFLFLKRYLIDNGIWATTTEQKQDIIKDEMKLLLL